MTYYGAKELAESFRTVRKNTIQAAQDIPEEKYSFAPAPNTRTVGKMLTHIALGTRFQHRIHGVEKLSSLEKFDFMALFQKLEEEEAKPRNKAAVIELLTKEGELWASFLDGVSEDFLGEHVIFNPAMTPPSKSRFEMVLSAKEHEMHVRAQLFLIERMIGIVPHLTRQRQEMMAQRQAQPTKS